MGNIQVVNGNDSGIGSLRDAIQNSIPNGIITIDPATVPIITLTSGSLVINKSLVIKSTSTTNVTITRSGNNNFGIFNIVGGQVTLSYLDIANGNVANSDENSSGGAIYNTATLIINNCNLNNNTSKYVGYSSEYASYGGALCNDGGSVSMDYVRFVGNLSDYGGAIFNSLNGVITATNSTFSGNGAKYSGGAIYNAGQATTSLSYSTINSNNATNYGGGIFNIGGDCNVSYSTINNNVAGTQGGGIHNNAGSIFTLFNSTIVNNNTQGSGSIYGDGIYNNSGTLNLYSSTISANDRNDIYNSGVCNIGNTIVNLNLLNSASVVGFFVSKGTNFISNGSGANGFISSDMVGNNSAPLDALLGPLQNNGGNTLTLLPLYNSPVLNKGNSALIPSNVTFDQRGNGYPRILSGYLDIGAVETVPSSCCIL